MMALRPRLQEEHRFAINLANRLVKLATVTWAVWSMSRGSVLAQFTAKLNSGEYGRGHGATAEAEIAAVAAAAAAASAATAGAVAADVAGGGGGLSGVALTVIRTIASVPSIWASHTVNFVLPFWVMLPLQVYTLAITFRVMPPTVCALAAQPPRILLAAKHACRCLRSAMSLAVLVSMPLSFKADAGRSRTTSPDGALAAAVAGSGNSGGGSGLAASDHGAGAEDDLLLLVLFTYTMVLLVAPCTAAYFLELSAKLAYIREQRPPRPRDASAGGCAGFDGLSIFEAPNAWLKMAYFGFVAVCVAWLACDAAVSLLPPVSCGT